MIARKNSPLRWGTIAFLSCSVFACSSQIGDESSANDSNALGLCGPLPKPQLCKAPICDGDAWNLINVKDGTACQPPGTYPALYQCVSGQCDPVYSADVYPHALVVMIMYAPPGNKSTVTYGNASTAGSSFTTASSFKNDLDVGVSTPAGGTDLDWVFEIDDKNTVKLTKSVNALETAISTTDGINHDNDQFVLWVNPRMTISQTGAQVRWRDIGVNGSGITTVTVTAAQLKDPSTMPAEDQELLTLVTDEDRAAFLALDPFVNGGTPDFGGRYVQTGFTMEYQPATSTELKTVNSRQTTVDHGWQTSITFGITLGPGLPFSPFKITNKMTLAWSGTQETTGESDQSADIILKTTTPDAAGVFDVYFDNMFQSFLFVPTPPPCIEDPVATTCAGKQCGPAINNCMKTVTCPDTCALPATCGGGGAGPNACGCTVEPISTTCAGKQCGPAINNCGQAVTCPDTCAPGTCGVGTGANSCGCISTGDPCGTRCGGTMTDNCGNVFTCHASCGLDGECPVAGGSCSASTHTCICRGGPGL